MTGSPGSRVGTVVLARSNSPRAPEMEHLPVSEKHELNWLLPADPLVVGFTWSMKPWAKV